MQRVSGSAAGQNHLENVASKWNTAGPGCGPRICISNTFQVRPMLLVGDRTLRDAAYAQTFAEQTDDDLDCFKRSIV